MHDRKQIDGFDLWRLTPLSTIFQLYRGGKKIEKKCKYQNID
jgi:hypothetical protein